MTVKTDRNFYQFRNAAGFTSMLDSMYTLISQMSPENLQNFLNIDDASGDWLTQLAGLFNVPRVLVGYTDAFILDVSTLDDTDVLDGISTAVNDSMLKALLKARIKRNTTHTKTIEYIYDIFISTIAPDSIQIVESFKHIDLNITVTDPDKMRILSALLSYDPKWFGCPAGVSVQYNII